MVRVKALDVQGLHGEAWERMVCDLSRTCVRSEALYALEVAGAWAYMLGVLDVVRWRVLVWPCWACWASHAKAACGCSCSLRDREAFYPQEPELSVLKTPEMLGLLHLDVKG